MLCFNLKKSFNADSDAGWVTWLGSQVQNENVENVKKSLGISRRQQKNIKPCIGPSERRVLCQLCLSHIQCRPSIERNSEM